MTFRRTASGLNNLHLFFNVDAVVYCEGGKALSVDDAFLGSGDSATLDCAFWKRIALFVGAKRKYHFKSVGSKSTLMAMIGDIATTHSSTVIICIDRDFDWHCRRQRKESFVAHTYGYSWESDVVSEDAFENVLFQFRPRDEDGEALLKKCVAEVRKFAKLTKPWTETEIHLSATGRDLLFKRDKPLSAIDLTTPLPCFSRQRAASALSANGFKRRPAGKIKLSEGESLRHCWGKMVSRYFYQLLLKAIGMSEPEFRLTYDAFMRLMTSASFQAMALGRLPNHVIHYRGYKELFA